MQFLERQRVDSPSEWSKDRRCEMISTDLPKPLAEWIYGREDYIVSCLKYQYKDGYCVYTHRQIGGQSAMDIDEAKAIYQREVQACKKAILEEVLGKPITEMNSDHELIFKLRFGGLVQSFENWTDVETNAVKR